MQCDFSTERKVRCKIATSFPESNRTLVYWVWKVLGVSNARPRQQVLVDRKLERLSENKKWACLSFWKSGDKVDSKGFETVTTRYTAANDIA